jgi:hypothetical protein
MMMDECYCGNASGFCRYQRAQEVKVRYDDIRRLVCEFRADMVAPDRRGEKAPGKEDIRPQSLRGPSAEQTTGGGNIGEWVLVLVEGDQSRPHGADALKEAGTGGTRREVRL